MIHIQNIDIESMSYTPHQKSESLLNNRHRVLHNVYVVCTLILEEKSVELPIAVQKNCAQSNVTSCQLHDVAHELAHTSLC